MDIIESLIRYRCFISETPDLRVKETVLSVEAKGSVVLKDSFIFDLLELMEIFKDSIYAQVPELDLTFDYKNSISDIKDILDNGKFDIVIVINKLKLIELFSCTSIQTAKILLFIYGSEAFRWLEEISFREFESNLSMDRSNIILITDVEVCLENENIKIYGKNHIRGIKYHDKFLSPPNISDIKEKIYLRNRNCAWQNGTMFLTPDFLYFSNNREVSDYEIIQIIDRLFARLVVAFLADVTEDGQYLLSKIYGYKTVSISLNSNYVIQRASELYEIYKWAYGPQSVDKLGIFRYLSSMYFEDEAVNNLKKLDESVNDILQGLYSNYEIYQKENVQMYFDQRKKIEDFIHLKVNSISQDIHSVLGTLTKNVLTMIATSLGGLIGYISNNNKNIVIGSIIAYAAFVLVNTAYYGVYTNSSIRQTRKQYDNFAKYTQKTFTKYEFDSIVGSVVNDREKTFWRFWCFVIGFSLILIILGIIAVVNIDLILSMFPPQVQQVQN